MKMQEIIDKIYDDKKIKIKKIDISKAMGISRQYVDKLLKESSDISEKYIELIESEFEIELTKSQQQEKTAEDIFQSWAVQFDLTQKEQDLLAISLNENKETIFLLLKALKGDAGALDKLKKFIG